MAYDHTTDRCGVDIDIGIPRQWIRLAERVAVDQGFMRAEFDAEHKRFYRGSSERRAAIEADHYELGFLVREQAIVDINEETAAAIRRDLPLQEPWHETSNHELACYVTLDLHHGLGPACPIDGVIASSREFVRDEVRLRTPSMPWVLLHLIHKLYLEGVAEYRKGGYQYADLVRLMVKTDASDAEILTELLSRQVLGVPAYYVLRRLPTEFGVNLPTPLSRYMASFARAPARGQDAYKLNDLGDMWPKLWGYR
jgi:hypothetical protein